MSGIDVGTGPVTVLVHGLGTNACLWSNLIAELSTERRCIAIDLPAHGGSIPGPEQDLSLRGLADAVGWYCDALGVDTFDLIGNDTGGAVAQIFAAAHPERLRTLTLTNCEAGDNIPNPAFRDTVPLAKRGELAPRLVAMYQALESLPPADRPLGGGYERPDLLPIDVLRAYVGPVAGSLETARHFERIITRLDPADLSGSVPGLRKLSVPTFIVWGTNDPHYGVSWAYWLLDTIAGADEVVELPGAKLFFPDERAAEFAGHLRRYWQTHDSDAPARI
ncbi:alpha/beta fold hydrolase [Actinoplanes sp. N902-109]|uniref:alpha/beta fold hydrolase n=1 Tax=Actinoplanes sp. (strain N902-109) TaxID=649831 RepID=UPI0018DDE74F|nr:alpha/beta hydrolase [Actinoplanes sp. N902-109]